MRTRLLLDNPVVFRVQLYEELESFELSALRKGLAPAVRLNTTSDLDWRSTVKLFPRIRFYDYTKSLDRMVCPKPSNYHLTFSRSETNDGLLGEALEWGCQVAMVVAGDTPRARARRARQHFVDLGLKTTYRFSDGDAHDLTWQHGDVIVLSPKGRAKQDRTGFVIR